MRTIDFDCCNPDHGCPYCLCIRCWDDGKMPECSKIKDKPHVKYEILCKHCIKDIKGICYSHYFRHLLNVREIKHEKMYEEEYRDKVLKDTPDNWKKKFNLEKP